MRALWFSNCPLAAEDAGSSGTWLDAMGKLLGQSGEVRLSVIAHGVVKEVKRQDIAGVRQYVIPIQRPGRSGLPRAELVSQITRLCKECRPDLVHVWGTESYWGLLTARKYIAAPTLITLQGLRYSVSPVYFGGMSSSERKAATAPRDIARWLLGRDPAAGHRRWARHEVEILRAHRWACVQTPWQEAHLRVHRPDAVVDRIDLPLRPAFYEASGWRAPSGRRIFCSAAWGQPYKGLHTAIRALALVKRRHPDVELRIAGVDANRGLRGDGYRRWLQTEVDRLGLGDQVHWLGPLPAARIVEELAASAMMVIPTFVESYCMALAEAMFLGTPTVVSFTGGTSFLGSDNETCLMFPPGDEAMCAYQMERLLADADLAWNISRAARAVAVPRHEPQATAQAQLAFYKKILSMAQCARGGD